MLHRAIAFVFVASTFDRIACNTEHANTLNLNPKP